MTVLTPDWVKDAIFYQIFPDRFAKSENLLRPGLHLEHWDAPPNPFGFKGGDLMGVTEQLDYLQDLGITAIYFNPVFASAANHRYHTYDYYHVDPLLGGNDAFQRLLNEAHARGMRIILDGVFNHASRGFWQFHHTLENGAGSPYTDWFHFDPDRLYGRKHFAPYPDAHAQQALEHGRGSFKAIGYQAWWDLPALPKFNTNAPAVREFLWNVATYWIEFGVDGWRLDVATEIDDDEFWREFRRRVKGVNPDAYIVGEIWHESKRWLQGDQFDAVMNYPVTLACLGFFGGQHLDLEETRKAGGYHGARPMDGVDFAEAIDTVLNWYDPQITLAQLNLLDSHDTPRFITSVREDWSALQLAYLFLFTYPGAPCIYYGDEVGLTGGHDPACRASFPWEETQWKLEILTHIKKLIELRKAYPALRRGAYQRLYADRDVYAFGRWLGQDRLIVAFNTGTATRQIDIPLSPIGLAAGTVSDAFQVDRRWPIVDGMLRDVKLPPRSGLVLT